MGARSISGNVARLHLDIDAPQDERHGSRGIDGDAALRGGNKCARALWLWRGRRDEVGAFVLLQRLDCDRDDFGRLARGASTRNEDAIDLDARVRALMKTIDAVGCARQKQ